MKQTSVERIGRSQLIPGVGPTCRGGVIPKAYHPAGMTDDGAGQQLHGHEARNASLLARIRELGAPLDVARLIDCFFWAPDRESAESLRVALVGKGLVGVECNAPPPDDSLWSVQGQLSIRPDVMASQGMTEQLVQLATSCGAEYDGWGTSIGEARKRDSVDETRGGPTKS